MSETHSHRGVTIRVEGDRQTKSPDDIMAPVNQPHLKSGMLISIIAHVLLVGLTSFGLYSDWAQYGVKMPHEIKTLKKEAVQKEAEEKRAEARAAQKQAAEQASAATPAAAGDKAPDKQPGAAAGAEAPTPDVVREATDVINERPTETSVDLDADFDLE